MRIIMFKKIETTIIDDDIKHWLYRNNENEQEKIWENGCVLN